MRKRNKIILLLLGFLIFVFVLAKTSNFYSFLFHLLVDKKIELKQSAPQKINILLLGIGGGSHDGPNLTDTIILANVDEAKNTVNLVSIPRDLWVPDLSGRNKKINTAYAVGELKKQGGGIALANAAVKKVTGQNIDYTIRIDFSGFVKAVDIIGGLDINVDNTLDDYNYPISGKEDDPCGLSDGEIKEFTATVSAESTEMEEKFSCRYMHVHFDKGLNHMDGEQALEYVRSRKAVGGEGSDFARSKRQQKVISAFKDKIFSAETIFNPSRIINLYNTVKDSIDTNITYEEMDDFIRLAQKMKGAKIQSSVIDVGDGASNRNGLLVEGYVDGLDVLTPRIGNGDFSEISNYVSCQFKIGNCKVSPSPTK